MLLSGKHANSPEEPDIYPDEWQRKHELLMEAHARRVEDHVNAHQLRCATAKKKAERVERIRRRLRMRRK